MPPSKSRVLVFKNEKDFDEAKAEEFIKHFYPLSFYICKDYVTTRRIYCGLDVCESAAYEACFKAYQMEIDRPTVNYLHQKGRVRICSKFGLISMLTTYGYLISSGQKYFPTEWVPLDYFNQGSTIPNIADEIDKRQIECLLKSLGNEYENEIIDLFLLGYDFVEIGERLGRGKSAISKKFQTIIKRFDERIVNVLENVFHVCPECGTKFFKRDKRAVYCSRKCMRKTTGKNYYNRKKNILKSFPHLQHIR